MIEVVPPEAAGTRLDVFLAPIVGSRAKAQALIENDLVRVDGLAKQKRYSLLGGETIEVQALSEGPRPEVPPAKFEIAYEDDRLIVVNKPAGVVVHPGVGNREGTLVQALAGRVAGGNDPDRPGVVHRLDRDTSGLLLLARDEATMFALQEALRRRDITREYVALVEGRPPARRGTIDAPLGRDRRTRTKMSTDTDDPHEAVTHFETEQALPDDTLLRVTLETGRTHQIRAHLLAIGHPVAGDPEYGHAGRHGLSRQFLHAQRLAFKHPETGAPMELRAPLPEDLVKALRQASGERADQSV
ncbi:RluA family pseudouridine synthase [Solirubrobacter phytolaccae]|uniref:Pseudouridine synthase n=1 Tax=Solirubrobacter phytolaccae TaxID=1404360 RepID=A0A9X3N724_9ACTN|nr:RluA family pseudouridine synthase [Solirubrobacter phytolaccae]MDA0180779.1 RluA family pseudouridine synthase [Solirubrobacter phytolaccae]